MRSFLIGVLALFSVTAHAVYVPYPVTSGANKFRVDAAKIGCATSGQGITTQSSAWLSSLVARSGSCCVANVAAGTYGTAPFCIQTPSGTNTVAYFDSVTTSVITVCQTNTSGSSINFNASIICFGARP